MDQETNAERSATITPADLTERVSRPRHGFPFSVSISEETIRQKISKGVEDLNNTINHLDLIDICRLRHPTPPEYTRLWASGAPEDPRDTRGPKIASEPQLPQGCLLVFLQGDGKLSCLTASLYLREAASTSLHALSSQR